jgi:hypothetical protein
METMLVIIVLPRDFLIRCRESHGEVDPKRRVVLRNKGGDSTDDMEFRLRVAVGLADSPDRDKFTDFEQLYTQVRAPASQLPVCEPAVVLLVSWTGD